MDRRGCGEVPCYCGWQQQPPQGYHYGSASGGATLPRQRGRLMATHSESSWRSPGRSVVRAKGGSCDLWSECGCPQSQSWQDHYQAAVSMLKQDFKEGEMSLSSALALAVKVLNKTMDVSKLSAEKVEIATLTRENGKTCIKVLKQKEVDELIKRHEAEEAKAEKEKKEKEQKEKDK